jgi:hypothetical protein
MRPTPDPDPVPATAASPPYAERYDYPPARCTCDVGFYCPACRAHDARRPGSTNKERLTRRRKQPVPPHWDRKEPTHG